MPKSVCRNLSVHRPAFEESVNGSTGTDWGHSSMYDARNCGGAFGRGRALVVRLSCNLLLSNSLRTFMMLKGIVDESDTHPILRWGERVNNQIKRGIPENSDSLILRNCRRQGCGGHAEAVRTRQQRRGQGALTHVNRQSIWAKNTTTGESLHARTRWRTTRVIIEIGQRTMALFPSPYGPAVACFPMRSDCGMLINGCVMKSARPTRFQVFRLPQAPLLLAGLTGFACSCRLC